MSLEHGAFVGIRTAVALDGSATVPRTILCMCPSDQRVEGSRYTFVAFMGGRTTGHDILLTIKGE